MKWKFVAAFVAVVMAVSMLITSTPQALTRGPIIPELPSYPDLPTVELSDRFLEKDPGWR